MTGDSGNNTIAILALLSNFVIAIASPWIANYFAEKRFAAQVKADRENREAQHAHEQRERRHKEKQVAYAAVLQADTQYAFTFSPTNEKAEGLSAAQIAYWRAWTNALLVAPRSVRMAIGDVMKAREALTLLIIQDY
jgi:GH15 family glucan-1,4-alpha-glucosidase